MEVKNVDLEHGVVKYPITKTKAFEMPLSDYMVDLLRNRIADNAAEFGAHCRWVFPSVTAASGHLEEEKLTASEPKLFKEHWSPHTLRHSCITIADQKVKISDSHQRALTNHKPKRAKNGDAHAGYIHPDLEICATAAALPIICWHRSAKPGRGNVCYSRDISPNSEFYCLHFPLAYSRRGDVLFEGARGDAVWLRHRRHPNSSKSAGG